MSDKTKTPALRFPDSAPWKKKRLNEIVSFKKGKGYSKADLLDKGMPIFLYGRMYTDYRFSVDSVDTFAELRNDSVLSTGAEVVVPASGETAEDIARATAIQTSGIILGGDLNVLTPLVPEMTDTSVLALALSNGSPSFDIATRAQGGTIAHVHKDDLDDVSVSLPTTLSEQRRIGKFFRELDALIVAREESLGKLDSLKKAMLEKMFPQGGARVPEVRFKGFTGEWEEKKLDEVVSFKKGKGYSKADLAETGAPVFLYGRMYTDYRFFVDSVNTFAELRKDSVFSTGVEVVVPASGETAEDIARATAIMVPGIIIGGDLNVLTPLVTDKTDAAFLALVLTNGSPASTISKRAQGGTIAHVHKDDLEDVLVRLPHELAEQSKIGSFFRSLDAMIAARREEVEKLKQLKKAFLERMFA